MIAAAPDPSVRLYHWRVTNTLDGSHQPDVSRRLLGRRALPKWLPPRRRGDTVRRERLHALLADSVEYDVTVIGAPAGFGKSTLAVDWCAESALPAAWLSLDRGDTDPLVLIADLVGAVRQRFPTALEDLAGRLAMGAAPQEAGALVAELGTAIQSDVDELAVLIVDDLHLLDDAPSALDVVDTLIRGVPMNMRVLLLSRTFPALPSLARLSAQRRAFTISSRELVFTPEEADAFLTQSHVDDPEARAELARRADGWAAALAVLADRYEPGRPRAAESDFILDQFIDHEVLDRLDARHINLLTSCSVLPLFDLEFAQALTGDPQAGATLRDLERTNHFLIRLGYGDTAEWFRMHALLREHLIGRLEREQPARLLELRRQAAALAHRRGMTAEAMELSLDARDWPEVVRELEDECEALYQRGEWGTLAGWIDRLPREVLDREADLAITRARLAAKFSRSQECLVRLDEVERQPLGPEQKVRAQLYRGIAHRGMGRLTDAIAACRRARVLAREHLDDGHPLYAEIDLEEGTALGRSGQLEGAQQRFSDAAEAFDRLGDHHRGAEAHNGLGSALYEIGRLAEAMSEYTAAQRRWRMLAEPQAQVATMNNMGNVQHMLGELETARDTYTVVVERAVQIGQQRYASYGREGLATVERDLGRLEAATTLYTIAIHEAQEVDDTPLILGATYGLAMCYRERGELARARTLLDHGLRSAEQSGALLHQARFRIGIGATLLAQGQAQEALTTLEAGVAAADETGARREQALGRLLLAAACYHGRRRVQVAEYLDRVHEITEELGYDQFLIVEARQIADVIEHAAARRVAGDYYRRLADRLRRPDPEELPVAGALRIRAEAFGTPRVVVDGRDIPDLEWRSERAKELLFFLLQNRRPLRKEEIAVGLWPDIAPRQVNSAFHTTLYRLRRAIHPQVVIRAAGGYQVNPDFDVWYDAAEFEEVARATERSEPWSQEWVDGLARAVGLYRGPFGVGLESEWVEEARGRYQDMYLTSMLALAQAAMKRGDPAEAVRMAQAVVDVDPLNEDATFRVMEAHARRHDLDQAARSYRRLSDALRAETGSRPSPRLRALYDRVLSGEVLDDPDASPGLLGRGR
ncbi:MAG: hypothetical protein C4547_03095 [Phycisphaerales bacterium]|nr:MAG: hypothetical protein C4547_03095 [Phycisphaerales bacterium]